MMMQSMKWNQSYITMANYIIDSTSYDGKGTAWKRMYGSHKLSCSMHKRSCNATSKTICWSDFALHGAVEDKQELQKLPEQVIHK